MLIVKLSRTDYSRVLLPSRTCHHACYIKADPRSDSASCIMPALIQFTLFCVHLARTSRDHACSSSTAAFRRSHVPVGQRNFSGVPTAHCQLLRTFLCRHFRGSLPRTAALLLMRGMRVTLGFSASGKSGQTNCCPSDNHSVAVLMML